MKKICLLYVDRLNDFYIICKNICREPSRNSYALIISFIMYKNVKKKNQDKTKNMKY